MKATKTLGLVAVAMLMASGSAQAWDWQFETARHTMTAKGVYMDLSSDGIPHLAIEEQSNIRHAVRGMLPHNSLGRQQLKKMKIYAGPDHPHKAQQPEPLEI